MKDPRESKWKLTIGVPLSEALPRRIVFDPLLAVLHEPRSPGAEMFRRLRASVAQDDNPAQVIAVTSAAYDEGKASVATNLALAFTESGQERVILVDADMRRPAVQRWISPEPHLGLSHVLSGATDLEHALHHLTNTSLRFIPAGVVPLDPLRLLSSEQSAALIKHLRTRFDRIIVNMPPVLKFPDATAVGRISDSVLLVTRSGTKRQAYLDALDKLQGTRVLGAVRMDDGSHLADGRTGGRGSRGSRPRAGSVAHGRDFVMFEDGRMASAYNYRWLGFKRSLLGLLTFPRRSLPHGSSPTETSKLQPTIEPKGTTDVQGEGFLMREPRGDRVSRRRRPTPSGPREPSGKCSNAMVLDRLFAE